MGRTLKPIRTYLGKEPDPLKRLRHNSFRDAKGCLIYGRGVDGRGYGIISIKDFPTKKAHVLAYTLAYGDVPQGMLIDHICGNKKCIEPEHLRTATPKQNIENQTKLSRANSSGYRGVYWSKAHNYWVAKIVHYGKQITRTGFSSAEEANEEAIKLRNTYFTHNTEQAGFGGK